MVGNFQDQMFLDFVQERTLEVGNELLARNYEYIRLTNASIEIYEELQRSIPKEFWSLLSEYEKVLMLLQGIVADSSYIGGFKDGLSI